MKPIRGLKSYTSITDGDLDGDLDGDFVLDGNFYYHHDQADSETLLKPIEGLKSNTSITDGDLDGDLDGDF